MRLGFRIAAGQHDRFLAFEMVFGVIEQVGQDGFVGFHGRLIDNTVLQGIDERDQNFVVRIDRCDAEAHFLGPFYCFNVH